MLAALGRSRSPCPHSMYVRCRLAQSLAWLTSGARPRGLGSAPCQLPQIPTACRLIHRASGAATGRDCSLDTSHSLEPPREPCLRCRRLLPCPPPPPRALPLPLARARSTTASSCGPSHPRSSRPSRASSTESRTSRFKVPTPHQMRRARPQRTTPRPTPSSRSPCRRNCSTRGRRPT